jgi:para-nitrobenzyl esterase
MLSARELASDRFLGYSTWKWVDLHGQTSDRPTFYYFYTRARPATVVPSAGQPTGPTTIAPGAVHSAEIEYAMGNLETNKVFAWTSDDFKVSRVMQDYFANFIKTGDPNGAGLPEWRAYNSEPTFPRLTIDVETRLGPDTRRMRYRLLDAILNPQQNAQPTTE